MKMTIREYMDLPETERVKLRITRNNQPVEKIYRDPWRDDERYVIRYEWCGTAGMLPDTEIEVETNL